jgi:Flp pilus assembly protein TadD
MKYRGLAVVALCAALGACATTTSKPVPRAQVEIQEQVGFTITESVTVSESVRMDYERALVLLEQGQEAQGIALLETVVATAPGISGPRIDLGVAMHRTGDLESAEKHLLSALELTPDHPVVHNELGIIYRKTGRFAESRRSYEAALAVYPGYHHARRNLGVLCDLYLADLQCALASYEAYMQTVPGDDQASMWIADLRNRVGQQE